MGIKLRSVIAAALLAFSFPANAQYSAPLVTYGPTATPSSLPPSGACGGDLGGTFPNCTVTNLSNVTNNSLSVTGGLSGLGAGVATLLTGASSGTGGPAGTVSPALTGTPTAPTPSTADNTTKLATTAYVQAQGYVTGGPYLPLAGGTVTGATVISGTSFGLSGNQSASGIFGTNGIRYKNVAGTLTDTTSSGTVATNYDSKFGGNTLTSTSATTITKNYGSYFVTPVCSTNVTCTNNSALGADSISINGAAQGTDALAVTGTATISGLSNFSSGINVSGTSAINLANSGGRVDFRNGGTSLSSPSNALLQFGMVDVDTGPVAQTLRTQGTLAGGTSNQAGATWTFIASPGKGTGAGGSFVFQTAPAGASGTAVNAPVTALTIDSTGKSTFAAVVRTGQYTVAGLPSAATAGAGAAAYVTDAVACTFLTTLTGGGSTGCPVVSDGSTWKAG